jgi:hypothetical protein
MRPSGWHVLPARPRCALTTLHRDAWASRPLSGGGSPEGRSPALCLGVEAPASDRRGYVKQTAVHPIYQHNFADVRTGRPMHVTVRLTKILRKDDGDWKLAGVK